MARPSNSARPDERLDGRGADANGSRGPRRERAPELVPSRQQYLDLKRQHPDAILLYRMGDFYETFDDDAAVVARDARITLTSRRFGRSGRVPMAGIPHHALNHYLRRLLAAGHMIAIAEQLSEPGRGLVERGVTRVLTPGTVADAALLPEGENRYLAAVLPQGERVGLAWVDVSTGEFAAIEFTGEDAASRASEELARLNPAERLIPDRLPDDVALPDCALGQGHQTRLEHWHFDPERARSALCHQFGVRSLDPYGCADRPAAIGAAGAILAYLGRMNPALLPLLTGLRGETTGSRVGLDAATRRNLELTRSLRTGGTRGSLLGVLDQTRTAMGARALRRLINEPLRDLAQLQARQAVVAALVANPATRTALAGALLRVGDLERLTSRVAQGQASARDLLTLASALRAIPMVAASLQLAGSSALADIAGTLDGCDDVLDLIDAAIDEGDDGSGVASVRAGFCAELDAIRSGIEETRDWLAHLERRERERTGIRSLKVGYNKVFGYYIEVTRPNLSLVPGDYLRKQTVATGERFVTAPLKEAEARVLAADDEIAALERRVLADVSARVTRAAARLLATAGQLAYLDALRSLAEVAAHSGWVAPELDESDVLSIVGGRHPVVEASLAGEPFIPNDCRLGGDHARLLVVTGPNMGGKSTYLRQVALIALLAQVGSFVPAEAARVGLVDRIFTRVGAQDDLAGGSSTFMVEMVETAAILHQASRRSLLILDEVGRGTSTQDGLAIARAVLEDIHARIGARALFATHYLELTALAEQHTGIANAHLAALESGGKVIFLYALKPGPADRSYGIQVARLAGLPPWVADRAQALIAQSPEPPVPPANGYRDPVPDVAARYVAEEPGDLYQLALDGFRAGRSAGARLADELRALDLERITPREALEWLFEQRSRLGGAGP